MSIKEAINQRLKSEKKEIKSVRNTGSVEIPPSLLCELIRELRPDLPANKNVKVITRTAYSDDSELTERDLIRLVWDFYEDLSPSIPAAEESKPGTPAFALEKMEIQSMSTTDLVYRDENENRRYRYFYVLDGVFSKGDFTYEQLRNLNNAGGFIGDFSGPERDHFSNIADICNEFVTGNGVIMRVKDANG